MEEEETITAEHYPQKEEGIEEDIAASDTKDETGIPYYKALEWLYGTIFIVSLQKIKEELEEKKKQCLQLKEKCSDWEEIAQSSATNQMTTVLLQRLKGM